VKSLRYVDIVNANFGGLGRKGQPWRGQEKSDAVPVLKMDILFTTLMLFGTLELYSNHAILLIRIFFNFHCP
jgi:hypothetical protein